MKNQYQIFCYIIITIIFSCYTISCNTSTSLTNISNLKYEDLKHFQVIDSNNYIIEKIINNKEQLYQFVHPIDSITNKESINSINFNKEYLALIAYPETDLIQYVQIEMLEQKADTLKLYYSFITTNELADSSYKPLKLIKLKKLHRHIQIIRK